MLLITRNCIRATAARHIANTRVLSVTATTTSDTLASAGKAGDDAATTMHEFMKGAEGVASSAGGRLEVRCVLRPQDAVSSLHMRRTTTWPAVEV